MPPNQIAIPDSEFLLEVRLDPQGRGISGVQFDLEVSPQPLQVVDIAPGVVLGPDPVEIEIIGSESGIATYAAARRGPTHSPTPAGAVAVVRLMVPAELAPGTPVQVSLQRVKIADADIHQVREVTVASPVHLIIATP